MSLEPTHDVIVIGSGASGTFAAYQLRDKKVLVLDVGNEPPAARTAFSGNLYELRKAREELHDELVGAHYESLHNIAHAYLSPKLKAPMLRYVLQPPGGFQSHGFYTVTSQARGGLANAWGAGVFPFTERELEGFPITFADLAPYYGELTSHIGISGAVDDLAGDLPLTGELLPPLELSRIGADCLRRYAGHKRAMQRRGFRVGRARLAVLTKEHRGRAACEYDNLEFFKPHIPAVYNPAYTLDELVRAGRVEYRGSARALAFREDDGGVAVDARDTRSGERFTASAKKLVLAAGTLNTARIVLASKRDYTTRLPLLDNTISYVPLLQPRFIGAALERRSFSTAQLTILHEKTPGAAPLFCTFYGLTGPLRSDYLLNFPLAMRDNLAAAKFLSPAMAIVQVFYPDTPRPENHVSLLPSGELSVAYGEQRVEHIERDIIRAFFRLGYLSHHSLCQFPSAGNSFHYAGCLPMKRAPGAYETGADGLLSDHRHVYVADGATLPLLPSKNLTFTLMANAMRIAAHAGAAL
jgi:choline dehydrogenase-like flavoprotein